MRVFRRIVALAALAATIAGCAGHPDRSQDRRLILNEVNALDPAPMTERAWSQVAGTYAGPVRSASQRGQFEGLSAMDIRLDLSGWADAPDVVIRLDNGYATAWTPYAERKGTYTNIPSKRYGAQGTVLASTHAPNQLLLQLPGFAASGGKGSWMILTFRGNGIVDVEMLGYSGWRGEGELWREQTPR